MQETLCRVYAAGDVTAKQQHIDRSIKSVELCKAEFVIILFDTHPACNIGCSFQNETDLSASISKAVCRGGLIDPWEGTCNCVHKNVNRQDYDKICNNTLSFNISYY